VLLCLQVTSFPALLAFLQHPAISSSMTAVRSLLCTCKSWRAALQLCGAANLCITIRSSSLPRFCLSQPYMSDSAWQQQNIQQLPYFGRWLVQHAGLVGHIYLETPCGFVQPGQYCDTVEETLAAALQAAAARPAAGAVGSAAVAQLPQLQLRSFTSFTSFGENAALLQALPAAGLTQLELGHSGGWGNGRSKISSSSTVVAGLARLSNLRQLTIDVSDMTDEQVACFQGGCLAGLAQLRRLTKLQLGGLTTGSGLQLLPQQLQQLQLAFRGLDFGPNETEDSNAQLALSHISALQQLDLRLSTTAAASSSLPASLTALTVRLAYGHPARSAQHLNLPALQLLQRLEISSWLCASEQPDYGPARAALSALSGLTHLVMDLANAGLVLYVAPIWRRLPALKVMELQGWDKYG
jgi:hypothetical protein